MQPDLIRTKVKFSANSRPLTQPQSTGKNSPQREHRPPRESHGAGPSTRTGTGKRSARNVPAQEDRERKRQGIEGRRFNNKETGRDFTRKAVGDFVAQNTDRGNARLLGQAGYGVVPRRSGGIANSNSNINAGRSSVFVKRKRGSEFDDKVPRVLPEGIIPQAPHRPLVMDFEYLRYSRRHPMKWSKEESYVKDKHSYLQYIGIPKRHWAHLFWGSCEVLRKNHHQLWWHLGMQRLRRGEMK